MSGPALEPARSGVGWGGEGFDCTVRPDKTAERGNGGSGGGTGRLQSALRSPELSHQMGRQESWSDSTEDSDGRGVSMLVTYLRVGNKSRLT